MPKEYKEITVLGEGKHIISVKPAQEWKDKKPVEGTHKQGTTKNGNEWYMYSTKVGNDWINLFAYDNQKELFDTGKVEVNVVKKFDPDTGEPTLKAYFNPVPEVKEESPQEVPAKQIASDLPWEKDKLEDIDF